MFRVRRILIICHGFPPYYGGAEHAAYDLAREAARDGFVVTVMTSDIGGRLPAEETMEGVRVVRIAARKKKWSFHTTLELLDFLRQGLKNLDRVLAEAKPDFIWAHFSVPAGYLAMRAGQRRGIPYGVVLHGSDVPGYQPGRFRYIYPVLKRVVGRVWRRASAVVAVSSELRALAATSWPGGSIRVIENGVDTSLFQPSKQKKSGEAPRPLYALVAAQYIERKGLQYLLQAIHDLPPGVRDNMVWHLCGSGPYEGVLRSLITRYQLESSVFLDGLLTREELANRLNNLAHLFVLPSLQEGLPLALLEALSAGCAVVATRVGGIPDALTDRYDALLCDPASPGQLAEAISSLAADPALRESLSRRGRETASRFSWKSSWLRYRDLMRENMA